MQLKTFDPNNLPHSPIKKLLLGDNNPETAFRAKKMAQSNPQSCGDIPLRVLDFVEKVAMAILHKSFADAPRKIWRTLDAAAAYHCKNQKEWKAWHHREAQNFSRSAGKLYKINNTEAAEC